MYPICSMFLWARACAGRLVPSRMPESTFWANYFSRVLRERRRLEDLKREIAAKREAMSAAGRGKRTSGDHEGDGRGGFASGHCQWRVARGVVGNSGGEVSQSGHLPRTVRPSVKNLILISHSL